MPVVVPSFSSIALSRPVDSGPGVGAIAGSAVANVFGGIARSASRNKTLKSTLASFAEAIAPYSPESAALYAAQADSIPAFDLDEFLGGGSRSGGGGAGGLTLGAVMEDAMTAMRDQRRFSMEAQQRSDAFSKEKELVALRLGAAIKELQTRGGLDKESDLRERETSYTLAGLDLSKEALRRAGDKEQRASDKDGRDTQLEIANIYAKRQGDSDTTQKDIAEINSASGIAKAYIGLQPRQRASGIPLNPNYRAAVQHAEDRYHGRVEAGMDEATARTFIQKDIDAFLSVPPSGVMSIEDWARR